MQTVAPWFWLGRERLAQLRHLQDLEEYEQELSWLKTVTREELVSAWGVDLSVLYRGCYCRDFRDR